MKNGVTPPRRRGRPRSFDRDQALESAMRLFWSRGYEGTSISDLTEAMGVTPPSLYAAYGDKKRLFFDAVERYEQTAGCFAREALTAEPTAERAVHRLLLGAVKVFAAPQDPKGCLMVLGATNCSTESAEVGEALAERRRAAETAVRARLVAGREAGEFPEHTDVDALAALVTATLFGLAVKARDGASGERLSGVVEQLMTMWPRRNAKETDAARTRRAASRPQGSAAKRRKPR
jgi:AcrR family transcriptional regulator